MKYKLIATDMDGTLLNDNHEVSEGNIESIKRVQQEKGVKFVLASGRPTFAMLETAEKLEMKKYGGYILSFNGGQLLDCEKNEIIFHEGLDKNDIEIIYNESKNLGLSMVLYKGDTLYGTELDEYVQFEAEQNKMKLKKINSLEELEENNINETTKCMILGSPEDIEKALEYMKSKYNKKYFLAISKPIFLEIANISVNKGKTLKKLGEILDINLEEMICVGDGGNDYALLKDAGMPVAVENAIEDIKKISKFISTSNNNDSLKTIIEEFYGK